MSSEILQRLFQPSIPELPDLINTWLTTKEEVRDILVMNECIVKISHNDAIENEEILEDLLGAGS